MKLAGENENTRKPTDSKEMLIRGFILTNVKVTLALFQTVVKIQSRG
jgi:hypothetical protein